MSSINRIRNYFRYKTMWGLNRNIRNLEGRIQTNSYYALLMRTHKTALLHGQVPLNIYGPERRDFERYLFTLENPSIVGGITARFRRWFGLPKRVTYPLPSQERALREAVINQRINALEEAMQKHAKHLDYFLNKKAELLQRKTRGSFAPR